VSVPPITSRPPKNTTRRSRASAGNSSPGEERRLDARLAQNAVAHRFGLAREPRLNVVLAAERLHHLDPDDRLVGCLGHIRFNCCTWRETGITRRAKENASKKTAGIDTSAIAASFTFTRNRTTAIPTIIITDWIPWVMPSR